MFDNLNNDVIQDLILCVSNEADWWKQKTIEYPEDKIFRATKDRLLGYLYDLQAVSNNFQRGRKSF